MIKKLKNYSLNLLSLMNIVVSFLFTIVFAKIYGLNVQADAYFYSIILFSNIIIFIQLFYSTFYNFYLKIDSKYEKGEFYYFTILKTGVVSVLVIVIYFILNEYFLTNIFVKEFLNIYIFTAIFYSLTEISIMLLNAESKFYFSYINTILRNLSLIIFLIIFEPNINHLAVGFLIYDAFFFFLIFILNVKYFEFFRINIKKELSISLIKTSILDRTGIFLFGLPELLISNILIEYFPGVISLYSYIKKIIFSIYTFIFLPQFTIFCTNIASYIKSENYDKINFAINRLWFKSIFFYIFLVIFTYFSFEIIIEFIVGKQIEISINDLNIIFSVISILYLFMILEYPYGAVINQKLMFKYSLKIKTFSFISFYLLFFIFTELLKIYSLNLLILLTLPNLFIFYFYYSKVKNISKSNNDKENSKKRLLS